MRDSDFSMLSGDASIVAPQLLGSYLIRDFGKNQVKVKIVETEAYDQSDAASHSFRGETPRTAVMFGPPGYLYVYFTYGMHYCCNIVVGQVGHGAAVLLRAVEPDIKDDPEILANRLGASGVNSTNGPAKLCQALKIDKALNGHDLSKTPLSLVLSKPLSSNKVVQTTRVGISSSRDLPLRFYIKGNPYVSKL